MREGKSELRRERKGGRAFRKKDGEPERNKKKEGFEGEI